MTFKEDFPNLKNKIVEVDGYDIVVTYISNHKTIEIPNNEDYDFIMARDIQKYCRDNQKIKEIINKWYHECLEPAGVILNIQFSREITVLLHELNI
jgi:hypothetical protein